MVQLLVRATSPIPGRPPVILQSALGVFDVFAGGENWLRVKGVRLFGRYLAADAWWNRRSFDARLDEGQVRTHPPGRTPDTYRGVYVLYTPCGSRHPVAVVTRDTAIPILSSTVCVLVTSTFHGHVAEVELGPGEGLDRMSAANCDNVFTLPKPVLSKRRGMLGPGNLNELDRAVMVALLDINVERRHRYRRLPAP